MSPTTKILERLTKAQNALYEHAHSHPCELKFLAIKLGKQGIDGEKLYGNPQMVGLPFHSCKFLESLTTRQRAIISAINYAYMYKSVARSEIPALTANMDTADKVFPQYSDEWMVLFQETQEEMDHIWTFRTVFNSILSQVGVTEALGETTLFKAEETSSNIDETPGFRSDQFNSHEWFKYSSTQQRSIWKDQSWENRMLYHLLYNMKSIPEHEIPGSALGALYLLVRYLANVHLKQLESFLFHNPGNWNYEPLAMEITQAHYTDEARHYSTSFDVGLELFKMSDPSSQKMIRYFLKHVLEGHMRSSYVTFAETVEMSEHGMMTIGLNALQTALLHPEFEDKQADIRALNHDWHQRKIGMEIGPLQKKRWRYISQQFERLIDAVGIKVDPEETGNAYKRYQEAFNYAA